MTEREWARMCVRYGFRILGAFIGAFIGLVIACWLGWWQ